MEDQTNANAEELDTQHSEQPAMSDPEIDSGEVAKKTARTLKLKAAEAADAEVTEEPASAPEAESSATPENDTSGEEDGQQGRSRRGRQRRPRRDPHTPSANPMSLTELKNKST
ncbi:MAG: hypothetical protein VW202_00835, partial [Halieaceae bacterium]